jgi:transposase
VAAETSAVVDVPEVINGLMYVLSTGFQWGAIPKDLPPRSHLAEQSHHQSFEFGTGEARQIASR